LREHIFTAVKGIPSPLLPPKHTCHHFVEAPRQARQLEMQAIARRDLEARTRRQRGLPTPRQLGTSLRHIHLAPHTLITLAALLSQVLLHASAAGKWRV